MKSTASLIGATAASLRPTGNHLDLGTFPQPLLSLELDILWPYLPFLLKKDLKSTKHQSGLERIRKYLFTLGRLEEPVFTFSTQ